MDHRRRQFDARSTADIEEITATMTSTAAPMRRDEIT
jgi:hypothetical protein